MLGCARRVAAERDGADVLAHERLPFGALAEADLQATRRRSLPRRRVIAGAMLMAIRRQRPNDGNRRRAVVADCTGGRDGWADRSPRGALGSDGTGNTVETIAGTSHSGRRGRRRPASVGKGTCDTTRYHTLFAACCFLVIPATRPARQKNDRKKGLGHALEPFYWTRSAQLS